MAFRSPSAPFEGSATLMPRSSYTVLDAVRRPRRDGYERREPEDCKEDIDNGVGVSIREAFDAVELGNGGLIDEERDAKPALFVWLVLE